MKGNGRRQQPPELASEEQTRQGQINRLGAYLQRQDDLLESVVYSIFGKFPAWVPHQVRERVYWTVQKLLNDGFSTDEIRQRVVEFSNDPNTLTIPGIVRDPLEFSKSISYLDVFRIGIAKGRIEGLKILSGDIAAHGQKFAMGRKVGTFSPVRSAVAKLLAKHPAMKPRHLWEAIKQNPPKGWQARESGQLGKYLDGPSPRDTMQYRRFCNVCSEERQKVSGKITG
jgi:hypothetical protein